MPGVADLGAGTAPVLTVLMWRFVPLALVLFAFAAPWARGAWRGLTASSAGRARAGDPCPGPGRNGSPGRFQPRGRAADRR